VRITGECGAGTRAGRVRAGLRGGSGPRRAFREDGLETNWQPTYNACANPVSIRLRQADLDKPAVQDLLRATFEILGPVAAPWSERQAEQPADSRAATAADLPATFRVMPTHCAVQTRAHRPELGRPPHPSSTA
jgi:hypothetical protein